MTISYDSLDLINAACECAVSRDEEMLKCVWSVSSGLEITTYFQIPDLICSCYSAPSTIMDIYADKKSVDPCNQFAGAPGAAKREFASTW